MLTKIATAAVYVDDQQKAVEFWTKQAGLELRRNTPMGPGASWIEVAPPGGQSCLVIFPKTMAGDWHERKPSIVFECADIKKTYEEMHARGVRFNQPPSDQGWGLFATFVDPDGNVFGLRAS